MLEILAVVAIIALVAGLTVPVLIRAKSASVQSKCLHQLHQIGLSTQLYLEQHESLPSSFDALVTSGALSDRRLLLCDADLTKYYGSEQEACAGRKAVQQSYLSMFRWHKELREKLVQADSNHGIIVCRLHGIKTEDFTFAQQNFCQFSNFMYEGTILRLRLDTSVQTTPVRFQRQGRILSFHYWKLFTDEPEPPMFQ